MAREARPPATQRTPFVGRQLEFAAFDERLAAADKGEGGVLFISGEAGIGKSRLAVELAKLAGSQGWQVLTGRAYDTEGLPPYLPIVEALAQHYGASADDDVLRHVLEGAGVIGVASEDLKIGAQPMTAGPRPGPEMERYRLFEAVSRAFLAIASGSESRGLLLCLDDLHWADSPTLLMFQHLARKIDKAPLLLVATYRDADVSETHPLFAILADLSRQHLQQTLKLEALSLEECTALIAKLGAVSPHPSVAKAIRDLTEGNPFFVEEVVRKLVSDHGNLADVALAHADWGIPESVRQLVQLRVSRVQPETRGLLQVASVLGDAFSLDLLDETADMTSDLLTGSLEEAESAGLLRSEADGYAFGHTVARRTIYDRLSLPRRRQLHSRVAAAMASLTGRGAKFGPEAIGHHWRLGGEPARAIQPLLNAGERAIAVVAWEEAARHWEGALECMDRAGEPPSRQARLLEGLGDLYFLSGYDTRRSVDAYERAATQHDAAGDRVGWARAHMRIGGTLGYPAVPSPHYPSALAHLREAETVLAAGPESLELGEMYAGIAHLEQHVLRSNPEEMLLAMGRLQQIAEKLDNDFLRVFVFSLQGHYLGHQGHLADGLALEERACDAAAALKGTAVSQWPELWSEYLLDHSRQQPATVATGTYQLSRPLGHPLMDSWTAFCCGLQSLELLDPNQARVKHERIRDSSGRFLIPQLATGLLFSGDLEALRLRLDGGLFPLGPAERYARLMLAFSEGRWQDALEQGDGYARQFNNLGSSTFVMDVYRYMIRLHRAVGGLEQARDLAQECLAIATGCESVKYEVGARVELALVAAEAGQPAEAEQHLARCRAILAEGEDWRGLAGRVQLAEGVVAAARRDNEAAAGHFTAALPTFQRLSLPWDEAETFELWARSCARFYRGRSHASFVLEKLDAARDVYHRIGAGQPWLDRLEAEQARLTGPHPGEASSLPHGLSEREVEVLRLIADGSSNREIAEQLVLSVRTVERHITNIYGKIGARGKADATAYALRHDLN
jgi:DNA-binding CsgD family transcriptional regulator